MHRERARFSISQICEEQSPGCDAMQYATDIERTCFTMTIDSCTNDGVTKKFSDKTFLERYSIILDKAISNINSTGEVGSDELFNKMISGEVSAGDIPKMTSFDMYPEASRQQREDIALRRKQDSEAKPCRKYWCKKCGKNMTTIQCYQSKAADEEGTLSIMCKCCGHIWRM